LTGGFPLFVIEAVRGTAAPGGTPLPTGDLAAVLRKRLEQGTAAAREVAGLAAAVGTNFTLDLLTEASDLEADLVVEAVDELWRRRIIREFGDGYDFSHDLLRETAELHPTSAGGAYVNFLMDEGQDRVRASYRGNFDRLAQVKRRYDPDNLFHINQNIQPASRSDA
jgi:predicted ATPase